MFTFTNGVTTAPGINDGVIFGFGIFVVVFWNKGIDVVVGILFEVLVVVGAIVVGLNWFNAGVLAAGNRIGETFVVFVLKLVENAGELVGNEAGIKGTDPVEFGGFIKVTVGSINNEDGKIVGKIICPFVNIFLIK